MPVGRKHISTKLIFQVQGNEKVGVVKYKSRWLMKCFIQSHGVYYDIAHADISLLSTLIVLVSLSIKLKMKINHMDVSTVLLNAVL